MALPEQLNELITSEAENLARVYKITEDQACTVLQQTLMKKVKLVALAASGVSAKNLARTRLYKDSVKEARKAIYYSLRRYKLDAMRLSDLADQLESNPALMGESVMAEILAQHVSTRERTLEDLTIYDRMCEALGLPESILDLGCGLQPLQFPFTQFKPKLRRYLALDRDPEVVRLLRVVAAAQGLDWLQAQSWELSQGWTQVSGECYELALMMKLVPVISRQRPRDLEILAATPARWWLLTGSKTAMTRHKDIERKDRRLIEMFLGQAKAEVISEFSLTTEFVVIARARIKEAR